jgi:LAS superfamily LD-carboxypeptidase LdcB
MATTATAAPGKTDFVKDFLQHDPEARAKTVNQAWQDAGFEGTISPTLVNKTRVKMNLTGNRRGKSKAAARKRPTPKQPATATETPGKTSFLKEFLHDNPHGNVAAVNQAWQDAGFTGTISPALVNKTRASLGLTGNLRGKTKKTKTAAKAKAPYTGMKRGRKPQETNTAVNGQPSGQPRGRKSGRTLALTDLEADIDRLIFKTMAIGDLMEIEDSLRRVRRLLYAALTRS